ncbi:MAG: nuclear transport factor 2 family protein [Actinomycetota bacterium]
MNRSDIEALARRAYLGLAEGDLTASRSSYAEDFRWHVPGANRASGTYLGAAQYFRERLERMAPLDEWKLAVQRVLVNEATCAALVELQLDASRLGRHVAMTCHHVLLFDASGRIVEATGFVEDQQSLDEFLS